MSLRDLILAEPWYVQLFILGGLTGGWWHFVDVIFGVRRSRPTPKGAPTGEKIQQDNATTAPVAEPHARPTEAGIPRRDPPK